MATLNRAAYDSARTWKCLLGLRLKSPILPAATIDEMHDSDNEADGNKADSLNLSASLFLIGRCILEYLQTVQYEYDELRRCQQQAHHHDDKKQHDSDNSTTATTAQRRQQPDGLNSKEGWRWFCWAKVHMRNFFWSAPNRVDEDSMSVRTPPYGHISRSTSWQEGIPS